MSASSERQRRFAGAELGRKRAGKKTETGMSESQLRDYAAKATTKAMPRGKPMPKHHGKPRDKKHGGKMKGKS